VRQRRLVFALGAAAAVLALVLVASGAADPARDRLRMIVQQECLPLWLKEHRADPCLSVTVGAVDAHEDTGYAILHDRKGGAHFLLIATRTIQGIESPQLEEPGAPNYFDAAWRSRDALALYLGRPLGRTAVGLALNSRRARSQDQLHIHISCLRRGIFTALQQNADRIEPRWSQVALDGSTYQALRIAGEELGGQNPVRLLAASAPGELMKAGQYTMLVAGMQYADGPGFAVLASATARGAELLLDSSCETARTPQGGS
jgi:CDP-diacylglycerol pyrophosphatase